MNARYYIVLVALVLSITVLHARVGRPAYLPSAPADDVQSVCASLRSPPPLAVDAPLSDDDIRRIGRQAYVWGWPLVYVHNCHEALARLFKPGRCAGMPVAPPNELAMLTDYITPGQTAVVCPNQDVVYGYGIFDLAREPVVVQVPDFGDRFWVYQLGDQRTDGFADVGKMYGTKPGLYLVVGPDWRGETPPGIAGVFRCPTRIGYCLPRVYLEDTAEDRSAVLTVVNQIMAYPLSRSGGVMKTCDWTKHRWVPRIGAAGKQPGKWVVPETFFDALGEVLDTVPPLAGEESLYAQFRRVLAAASHDARVRGLLDAAALRAESELLAPLFNFANFGTPVGHHWTTIINGAAFGTDYFTRAAVAKSNVYVNRNCETKYFYLDFDAQGATLDGQRSYRVTFAPGATPPVKGFWSLSLYDERHGFHPNDLGRYSLGTKNRELKYESDGSLVIYVGNVPPSAERLSNWIPAPAGKFSLYLRAYWPEPSIVDGHWTPPPVVEVARDAVAAK